MRNSPFLLRKTPSIRSKYWTWLNENVYSKLVSGAGVEATTEPAPANWPAVTSNEDTSWNPAIIASLSTFGLKSITFLSCNIPWTDELKEGISSSVTPASCK